MADIRMCSGKNCPLKDRCYRHNAPVNEFRQSYFGKEPFSKEDDSCEYFWRDD